MTRATMTSEQIQARILPELSNGPVELYDLAATLDEAPFRVRAELRALRRQRLVREIVRADLHAWQLTDAGFAALFPIQQKTLF